MEHSVTNLWLNIPVVKLIAIVLEHQYGFMRFTVGPRPRLRVPFAVVVHGIFSRQVVVSLVFVGFYAVIDADGRHGHRVDHKAAHRYPVVAVAQSEVGLVYFGLIDAMADNHEDSIFYVRIVE